MMLITCCDRCIYDLHLRVNSHIHIYIYTHARTCNHGGTTVDTESVQKTSLQAQTISAANEWEMR